MPRFLEMERRERSVILAMWRIARRAPADASAASGPRWSLFLTLRDGMEQLVRALAERLPSGSVRLKERVTGIAPRGERWEVSTSGGAAVDADAVVVAAEAHQAARMLRYTDPALAHLVEGIRHASSATVTLAYRREQIGHALDGFGFVVPHAEGRPIIAATFSSVKYPGRAPEGHVLLRVFAGGALGESILDRDDDELAGTARAELAALVGALGEPLFTCVARYPRAMPQYHVGHLARVEAIEQCVRRHPGLALAGGAYRGVGIADCVRSGEEEVERLLSAATARAAAERGQASL